MAKPTIGLALDSGAARGWAHIGVLETLEAEGIRPDLLAGCSIGAFVGAAYVTGRLDALTSWAKDLSWHGVVRLLDISLGSGGPVAGELIEKLMQDLGIGGAIEDLDRPFATIATNYRTGLEEWHRSGPIGKAVRASISLPGVMAPAKIDSDWFVDGGLVNPVPVSTCRAMGADFVIAVNLNGDLVGQRPASSTQEVKNDSARNELVQQAIAALPASWRNNMTSALNELLKPKPAAPGYFEVVANSINIMQDRITRSRLVGEPPHVMIAPRLSQMDIFEFDNAAPAIEEGRVRTRFALPEIKRGLGIDTSPAG